MVVVTACGGGTPPSAQAPASQAPASQAPAAPVATAAPATPAPAPSSWTMPDLVGENLQDAQNAIQRLTGYAIPITTSHDATGNGRNQISDRNWKVCSQNVDAGTSISPGTQIDFGAVKLDESC